MTKQLVNRPTSAPDRKVGYAALAATAASIVADLVVANVPALSAVDPQQLESLAIGLVTLLVGYFVRSSADA